MELLWSYYFPFCVLRWREESKMHKRRWNFLKYEIVLLSPWEFNKLSLAVKAFMTTSFMNPSSDGSISQTPFYRTSNELGTSFFEHRMNSNVFIYWLSNSNTLFLASNEWTLNIKPFRAFTRFTKLLIKPTQTSFFEHRRNSNVFIYW